MNNILQTIYNTGKFYYNVAPNLFFDPENKYAQVIYPNNLNQYDQVKWNKTTDGLIVVIHGLLGSPKTLGYEIAKKVFNKQKDKIYDVILPNVPFKGNCALDVAAKPIYDVILDYIKTTNSLKPIHIISCSNGCRIASWIEYELRNINVKIKLTCIAGAFNGSKVIDNFNLALSVVLDNNIIKDLSTESKTNIQLLEKINSEIFFGSREYEFYGTVNDWYIPNYNDCFPKLNKTNFTVIYHEIKYGYDHVSLGWYLSDEIVNNSILWLQSNNNNL